MLIDLSERELMALLPLLEDVAASQQDKVDTAKAAVMNDAHPEPISKRLEEFQDEFSALVQLDMMIEKFEAALLNSGEGFALQEDTSIEDHVASAALPPKKDYSGKN